MDTQTRPIPREAVSEEFRWDLVDFYQSDEDWEKDFRDIEALKSEYSRFRSTLGKSAAALKDCLEFDMKLSRKLEALYVYSHLKNDEDKTKGLYQGNFDRSVRLATEVSSARSFINSELMAIPEETMATFLKTPELELYRFHLERILRYRNHTLTEKEEAILASSLEASRVAEEAFGMLNNADLDFGAVEDKLGNSVAVTHGNFQSFMQNYDRTLRKRAFDAMYSKYGEYQHTFAALLSGSIKKNIFYSRARNHSSTRDQALFDENIEAEVYDNLIKAVRSNMRPLYRYFDIRKRILGLEELRVYDCSVPLVKDIDWRMGYEEATETITKAMEPLGEEYLGVLRRGLLTERWVDRYENKGKRSGAYSSGCYDSHPYILMNYRDDDINSIYTLAHEVGHSLHSYHSRTNQPYLYADYTIFVAEVASTFNEVLLTRHLLGKDISDNMRIYLICREIDSFRGTLYRQTMFAEFEREIYDMAEKGEPLTVDTFKGVYKTLLESYFGREVLLDRQLCLECFRIPHFYFSFYVYKYATGISAAYSLAERVLGGGPKELEDYLRFLRSGGSLYPLEILKKAGVDMATPEPINKALQTFASLVDQLETLTR